MSNITNINEQRIDDMPASVRHDDKPLLNGHDNTDQLSIKAKFERIIEAVKSGDVYNSKVSATGLKPEKFS